MGRQAEKDFFRHKNTGTSIVMHLARAEENQKQTETIPSLQSCAQREECQTEHRMKANKNVLALAILLVVVSEAKLN